ncbi:phosphoheptose isomerase [Emticicia sp. TH156]|uniref:phosphoheptose isomerase n=1 Tax=Emticicia sp. TH156 TaxID=2067454 RepID=UPI000C77FCB7|nr:phosphoheptose isomerase [Emticicia sp. TH156]PLK45322.1 phosphoheptose isomerase [Emticicia sp. TH156]
MNFSAETEKSTVFTEVEKVITDLGFTIANQDQTRPWGGFFVLDESQAPKFIETYFPHLSIEDFGVGRKLSPKILVVAPEKRLSWQYHFRRAEIWKVVGGIAGVVTSDTDEENELQTLNLGDIINLKQGERHRLIGLSQWGIIAEIWQHTDAENPSDEDDIVRVQDDFGR